MLRLLVSQVSLLHQPLVSRTACAALPISTLWRAGVTLPKFRAPLPRVAGLTAPAHPAASTAAVPSATPQRRLQLNQRTASGDQLTRRVSWSDQPTT